MGQIRVILTTDPGETAGTWVTFGVVLHTRGIEELDGVGESEISEISFKLARFLLIYLTELLKI